MPPSELAFLLALLPTLGAVVSPVVVALAATFGARAAGLDAVPLPGVVGLKWSTVAGLFGAAFAVCAALSLSGPLGGVAWEAAGLVLRLAGAAACLFLGAWGVRAREALAERDGRDRARDGRPAVRTGPEDTWILGAAGLAALATLAGAGAAVLVAAGALGALAAVALYGEEASARLRDALRDVAAGIELRGRLGAGASVPVDGQPRALAAAPGLLTTRLADGSSVANTALLASVAISAEGPRPAAAPPPDGAPLSAETDADARLG